MTVRYRMPNPRGRPRGSGKLSPEHVRASFELWSRGIATMTDLATAHRCHLQTIKNYMLKELEKQNQ